jgi:hypothetical protein
MRLVRYVRQGTAFCFFIHKLKIENRNYWLDVL